MSEFIFNGPEGRLQGRYRPADAPGAPVALMLHPHPRYGGTMNNRVVYAMYQTFARRGFAVLRFNFRGVGRSQGVYGKGEGELADAAAAMDWLQGSNPGASGCWVAGFSFGAWIAMQLLMRRPEIQGFVAVAPPANLYDFSFLAPCPVSGLIVQGADDEVVPPDEVRELVARLVRQKGIVIRRHVVAGANHLFTGRLDELTAVIDPYLESREDERAPGAAA